MGTARNSGQPRTEVCITVDTEFSIGGAFADPAKFRPVGEDHALCPAGGEENGLPFILNTLARFHFPATFFIETLNTAYFGETPLRTIADRILTAGQDLQLHLHPCWLHFRHSDWIERLRNGTPDDRCSGRSLDEMVSIIAAGLEPFERWDWPRPIASRTGGLAVDRTVFQAMAKMGLHLGSNIGFGTRHHLRDPELQVQAGRRFIEGVLEIPILAFARLANQRLKHYHLLTITGVSTPEMISVLRAARAAAISPVVILTHPHEFVKHAPPGRPGVRPNRINKNRLVSLCEFLADNADEYVPMSFQEGGPRWLQQGAHDVPEISAPALPSVVTLLQNGANDYVKWL